jgi:5-methyltetrahydropteroyltriglutamate--homocysteine methyltransferase
MLTHNLGFPRIGNNRELKQVCELYWSGKISLELLLETGRKIKKQNWKLQKDTGIDLVPSNDFSFYDHILDMSLSVGAIPDRYKSLIDDNISIHDLYFAMARGYQKKGYDITAMEMTKWFDTNYHYIVPEFHKDQTFTHFSEKILDEFNEGKQNGILTKPVLIGPVSYLLLGKEKEPWFNRIELIDRLLPVYLDIIKKLIKAGAEWIQFDEPFLVTDISEKGKEAFVQVYSQIKNIFPALKTIIATYFEGFEENLSIIPKLPVSAIHIDLVRAPEQLDAVLEVLLANQSLSLGIVDGRNIWKNDFQKSLEIISKVIERVDPDRIMIAPSSSLLHCPCDVNLETNEKKLPQEIKQWFAFSKQKLEEVVILKRLSLSSENKFEIENLKENQIVVESRKISKLIHRNKIKTRISSITNKDIKRVNPFPIRRQKQKLELNLPLFPATTIGSFPQTQEIRLLRAKLKKGELTFEEYKKQIEYNIEKVIHWQEEVGLDVLVHGEFERNDMVEYFGELLNGFVITENGWVQSYGSRCVKPPIIFGDVERSVDMTVYWSKFAQSKTKKPVKGMLTGPITILQWSFVRDDQPRSVTATQIALAIRDEVKALEKAGIKIIQIDEPAIREGLPLWKHKRQDYLDWAVKAFRLASCGVKDETQIHTHMCYSEFNDIIQSIADMDADVITIETSRSQMDLLDAFVNFKYPNEIGPGVYDIHSPRVPTVNEIISLLEKACSVLPVENIWVNPDCGLKTRRWEETEASLKNMITAAFELRKKYSKKINKN